MVKPELIPPIMLLGDVLVSSDILTERFCCDLAACKGECCVEGDEGAPVTMEEITQIEDSLDAVWDDLSASAQSVIERQGVAYTDREGELVTSIVNGKNCAFTYYDDLTDHETGKVIEGCCLCTLEKACRAGKTQFMKPISCALYPIREKRFANGLVGVNYDRWKVCKDAVRKGIELDIPVYRFLEGPLRRRFGDEWYEELCQLANQLLGD
jgi:hypothetical protein